MLIEVSGDHEDEEWGQEEDRIVFLKAVQPHVTPIALPWTYKPSALLPGRPWIQPRLTLKGYLTTTIAAGGTGKTTLLMAEALAVATGCPIMGHKPLQTGNVLIFNGEDPVEEINLRMAALVEHQSRLHSFSPSALPHRVFIQSGRCTEAFILTTQDRGMTIAIPEAEDDLVKFIRDNEIILVVVDPFVSIHTSGENDNAAVAHIARIWGRVADSAGCAIHLAHHARKGGGGGAVEEASRGASALTDASRITRVLRVMTEKEAEDFGIDDDDRFSHVCIDSGKVNLARRSGRPRWIRLIGVPLGNGEEVQTCEPWEPPGPFDDVAVADLIKVQQAVRAALADGEPLRMAPQAAKYAGTAVAEILKFGADADGRKKGRKLATLWLCNGALKEIDWRDKRSGRDARVLDVGTEATPGVETFT